MDMKRLAALLAVAMAVPAFGLTRSPRPGDRIGVLRMSDQFSYGAERTVANALQHFLRDELRNLGFHAFDARTTYDDLLHRGPDDADFYVEVVSSYAANRPVAGAGAAVGDLAVEVAVVVGQVAAEVRLYDGRTLNLIERYDLEKRSTAVVPTGIGIAGRSIWASVMLPFVQYGQYRAAAHDVARQAAARIAGK
jgi:hypothetical protein